jgi:hypothetical protein
VSVGGFMNQCCTTVGRLIGGTVSRTRPGGG